MPSVPRRQGSEDCGAVEPVKSEPPPRVQRMQRIETLPNAIARYASTSAGAAATAVTSSSSVPSSAMAGNELRQPSNHWNIEHERAAMVATASPVRGSTSPSPLKPAATVSELGEVAGSSSGRGASLYNNTDQHKSSSATAVVSPRRRSSNGGDCSGMAALQQQHRPAPLPPKRGTTMPPYVVGGGASTAPSDCGGRRRTGGSLATAISEVDAGATRDASSSAVDRNSSRRQSTSSESAHHGDPPMRAASLLAPQSTHHAIHRQPVVVEQHAVMENTAATATAAAAPTESTAVAPTTQRPYAPLAAAVRRRHENSDAKQPRTSTTVPEQQPPHSALGDHRREPDNDRTDGFPTLPGQLDEAITPWAVFEHTHKGNGDDPIPVAAGGLAAAAHKLARLSEASSPCVESGSLRMRHGASRFSSGTRDPEDSEVETARMAPPQLRALSGGGATWLDTPTSATHCATPALQQQQQTLAVRSVKSNTPIVGFILQGTPMAEQQRQLQHRRQQQSVDSQPDDVSTTTPRGVAPASMPSMPPNLGQQEATMETAYNGGEAASCGSAVGAVVEGQPEDDWVSQDVALGEPGVSCHTDDASDGPQATTPEAAPQPTLTSPPQPTPRTVLRQPAAEGDVPEPVVTQATQPAPVLPREERSGKQKEKRRHRHRRK